MRASILIAILGVAGLGAAGAAFAQSAAPADTAVNPPVAFVSSDALGDTSKMKAGDPDVVSNGPVPDTQENRAKYGRPMSHAGRATTAAGN